jgi:hypothetical protein
MRNTPEILELRACLGFQSYAIYLMLLETIAESDTQSVNQKLINGVAISFGCDPVFLKSVIEKCIELELFYTDENSIFSSHLQEHFEKRAEISQKRQEVGKLGGRPKKANENQLVTKSKPIANQTKANQNQQEPKESKESKENKENIKEPQNKFEEFWSLYPRKEVKVTALKAYLKATQKDSEENIISGLKKSLDELESRELKYRPMPATWLNQERWRVDSYTEPQEDTSYRINPATGKEWAGDELEEYWREKQKNDPPSAFSDSNILANHFLGL